MVVTRDASTNTPAAPGRSAAGHGKGTCHKCGGMHGQGVQKDIEKRTPALEYCEACDIHYHSFDCGRRLYDAGLTHSPWLDCCVKACPKCAPICACKGGAVQCYAAKQRAKRRRLAPPADPAPPPAWPLLGHAQKLPMTSVDSSSTEEVQVAGLMHANTQLRGAVVHLEAQLHHLQNVNRSLRESLVGGIHMTSLLLATSSPVPDMLPAHVPHPRHLPIPSSDAMPSPLPATLPAHVPHPYHAATSSDRLSSSLLPGTILAHVPDPHHLPTTSAADAMSSPPSGVFPSHVSNPHHAATPSEPAAPSSLSGVGSDGELSSAQLHDLDNLSDTEISYLLQVWPEDQEGGEDNHMPVGRQVARESMTWHPIQETSGGLVPSFSEGEDAATHRAGAAPFEVEAEGVPHAVYESKQLSVFKAHLVNRLMTRVLRTTLFAAALMSLGVCIVPWVYMLSENKNTLSATWRELVNLTFSRADYAIPSVQLAQVVFFLGWTFSTKGIRIRKFSVIMVTQKMHRGWLLYFKYSLYFACVVYYASTMYDSISAIGWWRVVDFNFFIAICGSYAFAIMHMEDATRIANATQGTAPRISLVSTGK